MIFWRSLYAWGFCLIWRSSTMIVYDLSMEMFIYKSWQNLDLLVNNVLSVNISEWQINLKAKSPPAQPFYWFCCCCCHLSSPPTFLSVVFWNKSFLPTFLQAALYLLPLLIMSCQAYWFPKAYRTKKELKFHSFQNEWIEKLQTFILLSF